MHQQDRACCIVTGGGEALLRRVLGEEGGRAERFGLPVFTPPPTTGSDL